MTEHRPTPEQIREQIEDEHDGGFTSSPSLREYDEAPEEADIVPIREIEPGVFVVHIPRCRGQQPPMIESALDELRRAVQKLRDDA